MSMNQRVFDALEGAATAAFEGDQESANKVKTALRAVRPETVTQLEQSDVKPADWAEFFVNVLVFGRGVFAFFQKITKRG